MACLHIKCRKFQRKDGDSRDGDCSVIAREKGDWSSTQSQLPFCHLVATFLTYTNNQISLIFLNN